MGGWNENGAFSWHAMTAHCLLMLSLEQPCSMAANLRPYFVARDRLGAIFASHARRIFSLTNCFPSEPPPGSPSQLSSHGLRMSRWHWDQRIQNTGRCAADYALRNFPPSTGVVLGRGTHARCCLSFIHSHPSCQIFDFATLQHSRIQTVLCCSSRCNC